MGTNERGPRRTWKGHGQPPGRMSRGQEFALFIVLMILLLGLIAYGLHA